MRIAARYVLIALSFFLWSGMAQAQSSVSLLSFTASQISIASGHDTLLSWQTVGGYGANLYFYCPTGVTVQDASGAAVACDTAVPAGSNSSSGSAAYTVINVSGVSQTLPVRIVAKDAYGNEASGAVGTVDLSIGAAAQTVTNFSASSLDVPSGAAATFSWTGVYVGGVNLQLQCVSGLQFVAVDSASSTLYCNQVAFSPDMSASGSVKIGFLNATTDKKTVRVTLLPAMGGGYYDATHALSLDLTVEPPITPVSPVVGLFSSSQTSVYNGEPFELSWNVEHAPGANLMFQCDRYLTYSFSTGTSTQTLPCGAAAFSNPLPAVGTTTIYVANRDVTQRSLTAFILPENPDGTYTTTGTKALVIRVSTNPPPAEIPAASAPSSATTSEQTPGSVPAASSSSALSAPSVTFTEPMEVGSRGSQVTALQQFLAQDVTLYPEGLVTGYFGTLTEKAVERFQLRYGVVTTTSDPGYGYVGPKTRAMLNSFGADTGNRSGGNSANSGGSSASCTGGFGSACMSGASGSAASPSPSPF